MSHFTVDALLRPATPLEIADSFERNPGAGRLRDGGWSPAWFELTLRRADGSEVEHVHSIVWRAPDGTWQEVADEETELALDEALRSLRDYEGVEVWPDDVGADARRVTIEGLT